MPRSTSPSRISNPASRTKPSNTTATFSQRRSIIHCQQIFISVGFWPEDPRENSTLPRGELQNREISPGGRGIFKMEGRKGWKEAVRGGTEKRFGWEGRRGSAILRSLLPADRKPSFYSIVVDTAFHATRSSHWRKRYSSWHNAGLTYRTETCNLLRSQIALQPCLLREIKSIHISSAVNILC